MKRKNVNFAELYARLTNKSKERIQSLRERIIFTCNLIDANLDSFPEKSWKNPDVVYLIGGLVQIIQELEFALQKEWNIPQDANYHTYWSRPKHCTCPKMDNKDRFGFGKIISGDCPLHGYVFELKTEKIKTKTQTQKQTKNHQDIIDILTKIFGE